MNCNCNNKDGALFKPLITLVQGNLLRLVIPLTLRTIELVDVEVDGEIQRQAESTDTPFIPSSEHPVLVEFSKAARRYTIEAEMQGNLAHIEDKGKMPVGTYDITVTCKDDSGNPYRFKQAAVLRVVDTTKEAGIVSPIEYEVQTWYLNAAIYMALKGEDGVVTPVVTISSTGDVTQTLDAGKFYKFGTVDSLTLTLNAPTACADGTVPLAMYGGKFTASVDGMNIGLPTGVNLTDEDNGNISIVADHTYEFNIADGIIYIKDVTVTTV